MKLNLASLLSPIRVAMIEAARIATARGMLIHGAKCSAGCSACCSRYICLTIAEASVLVEHLKEKEEWENVKTASLDMRKTVLVANPLAWFKMGIPCPILGKDKLCRAYDIRPVQCSSHFATSLDACSAIGPDTHALIDIEDATIFFKAMFLKTIKGEGALLRTVAPMPIALLCADRMLTLQSEDIDGVIEGLRREFG